MTKRWQIVLSVLHKVIYPFLKIVKLRQKNPHNNCHSDADAGIQFNPVWASLAWNGLEVDTSSSKGFERLIIILFLNGLLFFVHFQKRSTINVFVEKYWDNFAIMAARDVLELNRDLWLLSRDFRRKDKLVRRPFLLFHTADCLFALLKTWELNACLLYLSFATIQR